MFSVKKNWQEQVAAALHSIASSDRDTDPLVLLKPLLDALRPPRRRCADEGPVRWAFFLQQLRENDALHNALRQVILQLFSTRRQITFYTDSGLLPATGFFTELNRILMQKWLPELRDTTELRACVAELFSHPDDEHWLGSIPFEERRAFWILLNLQGSDDGDALRAMVEDMLEASVVLSHRIAAMGLSPELARAYPRLRQVESPFVAMNIELVQFVTAFRRALAGESSMDDGRHLLVMLDQCQDVVRRAHASASRLGTSLTLSFLLTRLSQHLERLALLIKVMTVRFHPESPDGLVQHWTDFLFDALDGERRHNSVRRHFSNLVSMLALCITDNAAHTGEHYIANTRTEWFLMLRDAAGAGVLIAMLALLKILGANLHLPATSQAWFNGLFTAAVLHWFIFCILSSPPNNLR